MKHATVKLDGREIPLIGIKPHYTEEVCDGCRQVLHLGDITLEGAKFLCQSCRTNKRRS